MTGSIVALLGKADETGYFLVDDICFAGTPFKADLPQTVNVKNQRDLFTDVETRKFICLTSGLNFGGLGE